MVHQPTLVQLERWVSVDRLTKSIHTTPARRMPSRPTNARWWPIAMAWTVNSPSRLTTWSTAMNV